MSTPGNPISSHPPVIEKPDDFDRFWRQTCMELNRYADTFERTLVDQRDAIDYYTIEFNAWQNTALWSYLLQWQDKQPRPLVIYTHGYHGQCDIQWQWARLGFNVFGFDSRGFGRSKMPIHDDGWILTGIDSPSHSILRAAICDYVRACEIAGRLTHASTSRTLYYGYSFGGAMALMGAALDQSADVVAAGVPSFGWMAGRRKLVKLGSGAEINRYIRAHPSDENAIMHSLAYFDTANFAPLITTPTLIGIGKKDVVVPTETVRAICGQLSCPHVIREFPYSHSHQPEEQLWQRFDRDWQQMALTGQLPIASP